MQRIDALFIIRTVNAKDYTKEQLNVWASGQVDLEKWNQSLQEHFTVVAVDNEIIVGFGDSEANHRFEGGFHMDCQIRPWRVEDAADLAAARPGLGHG